MTNIIKKIPTLTESDKKRLFSKALISDNKDECWPWQSLSVKHNGYGVIWIQGKFYTAHRIYYFLYYNIDPLHLNVCHTCDNVKCINPNHLFLGTSLDNNTDSKNKNRTAKGHKNGNYTQPHRRATGKRNGKYTKPECTPRGKNHFHYLKPQLTIKGERVWSAKLTDKDVLEIRKLYSQNTITLKNIGEKYGVSIATIGRIIQNKTWKHVGSEVWREYETVDKYKSDELIIPKINYAFGFINA